MNREDIEHLGTLARIQLSPEEVTSLQSEIDAILGYVSAINEIVADGSLTKKVGVRHNIFREDAVTNTPDQYTEAMINEMPTHEGRLLRVKKILNPDT